MLKEMLQNHNLIRLEADVEDWKEAIVRGVELLSRAGIVEYRYGDAIIESTEKVGPYYVICPGVAMPHSRPEDGVKENGISIITLKKPVYFGNADNDPVNIVISLAAKDNTSHLDMMQEVVALLSSRSCIDRLLEAKTIDEALAIFN